jgi:hypothetical protein
MSAPAAGLSQPAAGQQARDERAAAAAAPLLSTPTPDSVQVNALNNNANANSNVNARTGTGIAPPNTGDAGLASNSEADGSSLVVIAAIGLVVSAVNLKRRKRYL